MCFFGNLFWGLQENRIQVNGKQEAIGMNQIVKNRRKTRYRLMEDEKLSGETKYIGEMQEQEGVTFSGGRVYITGLAVKALENINLGRKPSVVVHI